MQLFLTVACSTLCGAGSVELCWKVAGKNNSKLCLVQPLDFLLCFIHGTRLLVPYFHIIWGNSKQFFIGLISQPVVFFPLTFAFLLCNLTSYNRNKLNN